MSAGIILRELDWNSNLNVYLITVIIKSMSYNTNPKHPWIHTSVRRAGGARGPVTGEGPGH